jgi:integrase
MAGKKRNRGEGSIFQRTDGRWCAQVDFGWQNGKRVRKYIYGASAKEVQERLLKARVDRGQGLPVAVERQTVADFLLDWLKTAESTIRPSTFVRYAQITRDYLIPSLSRTPLRELTPQHVQTVLDWHVKQGALSSRSIAHIRGTLRIALNRACKWNLIGRNSAALAEPPKVKRFRIEPLSPEQARQLLEAAKGNRLEALYAVALALGLRAGEILGLTWQNIDLEHGQLTVLQALQRQKGRGLVTVEPKTDRSRRTLMLPAPLIAALKAHRVRQLEQRLAAGSRWRDSGFVFTSSVGSGLEPRNLHRSFKAMLARAGLPDVRFHDLRHSAASLMLAQGVPLRVVMEVLGHSSIGITANVYSHVMPTLMQDAAAKMGDVLFREG